MSRLSLTLVACLILCSNAWTADLTRIERFIAKEPLYKTKAPEYCLLVFGPEAKTRVWLVRDGDTLYVDRNGNGDLTEPGEWTKQGRASDGTHGFQIDELSLPDDPFPQNSSGLWVYRNTQPMGFRITINQKTWSGRLEEFADRPSLGCILQRRRPQRVPRTGRSTRREGSRCVFATYC